jgi:limonene-1,2-epoxide hydrolase
MDLEQQHHDLVQRFVDAFADKDVEKLRPFVDPDIVFRNYGDPEVRGVEALLKVWAGVFGNFEVEINDGLIAAWRDYTDSKTAGHLLGLGEH